MTAPFTDHSWVQYTGIEHRSSDYESDTLAQHQPAIPLSTKKMYSAIFHAELQTDQTTIKLGKNSSDGTWQLAKASMFLRKKSLTMFIFSIT